MLAQPGMPSDDGATTWGTRNALAMGMRKACGSARGIMRAMIGSIGEKRDQIFSQISTRGGGGEKGEGRWKGERGGRRCEKNPAPPLAGTIFFKTLVHFWRRPMPLARLSKENLEKLPKPQRIEALLRIAQMSVNAQEDASELLERVQAEMDASSTSTARPVTRDSLRGASKVFHVASAPPSTAGGLSIAGSLGGRIADSLIMSELRAGRNNRANKNRCAPPKSEPELLVVEEAAAVELERPTTAQSHCSTATAVTSRPPTAASRRPPTAGSSRPPSAAAPRQLPRPPTPEPVYERPYDIIKAENPALVEKFRREYQDMIAAKRAEAQAAEAAEAERMLPPSRGGATVSPATAMATRLLSETAKVPLAEIGAGFGNARLVPRPLTGHSETSLPGSRGATPLTVTRWAKKGKRQVDRNQSSVGSLLSWD
jgi:hypothetical protein